MYMKVLFTIFLFEQTLTLVKCNDVLGCGGFIESHVPIDFSKIEVRLVTKTGIVKDRTSCAPNNGYYFLPIYDKGSFKLEVAPPPGWSFTPKDINLNIDGSDACSQGKDINFVFEGFGIAGKVNSQGNEQGGPKGILVTLSSNEGTRTTLTHGDGSFSFTPVFPGSYEVSISHPRWKIRKSSVKVEVKEQNLELPGGSLVVAGYDVTGKILTVDGDPVKNTIIVLYSQNKEQSKAVEGCDRTAITNLPFKELYMCQVTTDDTGKFIFASVAPGNYFVAPHFKEDNIYYQPDKLVFSVEHGSFQFAEHFKIVGFSVPGKVENTNKEGIAGAKIFLNGEHVATTDKFGKYKLEKLKVGSYRLTASAENVRFDEASVKLDPNLHQLPTLTPVSFKVCGKVISDKSQSVTIMNAVSSRAVTVETDENHEFCQYLTAGSYEINVDVDEDDKSSGVQFFPTVQKITVNGENLNAVSFSQLKSTISGTVNCIQKEDCEDLSVILKSTTENLVLPVLNSKFSQSNVHPGVYEVSLSKNELCWKSEMQTVNVNAEKVEIPRFVQEGYQVHFESSHEAEVSYKTHDGKQEKTPLSRGINSICLKTPGQYQFFINSCHEFDSDAIVYTTSLVNNKINLNAQKHTVELLIKSDKDYGPLEVNIHQSNEEFKQTVTFTKDAYEVRLMLRPLEIATISPISDKLFFTPQSIRIEGTNDCDHLGNKIIAVMGKVFEGRIDRPLENVKVTVLGSNDNEISTEYTDANGVYKFAPLPPNSEYTIIAQKDSYIFSAPDAKGVIASQKLAEISVEVLDEADKSPLAGVLLSLSGGQNFRKNLQTNADGRITFHSLSATDYFLKPMMKEYKFEPASKMIPVPEGETINIELKGKRVAFSAFGKLTTINDDPVENVNIVATGAGNCTGLSEVAITDYTGAFRIRGLQPYCSFEVSVQQAGSVKTEERYSPETVRIENINKDIKDLVIKVFRPVPITDVMVKVYADKVEHYRYLRVTLYRESNSPTVLYSTSLESFGTKVDKTRNYGIMIHMPSLQMDNNEYSIHLEPAHNIRGQSKIENFNANSSFKLVEFNFNPKTNIRDQPIKQSSVWAMMFILMVLILAYNIQTVLDLLNRHLNFNIESISSYIPIPNQNRNMSNYDHDIDQIVQDINNVKKHRSKKIN